MRFIGWTALVAILVLAVLSFFSPEKDAKPANVVAPPAVPVKPPAPAKPTAPPISSAPAILEAPDVYPPVLPPEAPVDPEQISGDGYDTMDRLTTFAILIGRGVGCHIDMSRETIRVEKWISLQSHVGPADLGTLQGVFVSGVQAQAEQQAAGEGPDSCAVVAHAIHHHSWP